MIFDVVTSEEIRTAGKAPGRPGGGGGGGAGGKEGGGGGGGGATWPSPVETKQTI